MRVVAFTGMPGSGKSEAVAEARKRGLPIVSMGDFVRETVRAQGLAATDENLGRVATRMRKEHGADWWARRTCDRIQAQWTHAPLVVIDGVRTVAEIRTFRERLGAAFHLVAIEAPPALRIERLRKRMRSDDPRDASDLAARDQREIAWGILEAIQSADNQVENAPPLHEFQRRIGALFDRLTSAG